MRWLAGDEELRLELLGAVRAWRGHHEIQLGPPLRRAVLCVLALQPDEVVSRADLVDALWGDQPPASAEGGIYTYVTGLRRVLGASALESSRAGYRLCGAEVDVVRFERHRLAGGRSLGMGDPAGALAELDAALALWADPLGGVPGPFASGARERLTEVWLGAAEDRAQALLDLGRADRGLVGSLTELAREHPRRERLRGLLMLALHRTGDRAAALAEYDELEHVLAEEIGLDPSPVVTRVRDRILDDEARRPAPAQLPRDIVRFAGRAAEIGTVTDLLAAARQATGVVIVAIDGMAGVGKTALAVHIAHQLADRYPDGRLYLHLRGYDPRHPPMHAGEALAHLLRALGADPQSIPVEESEQAAQYRSMVSGKRMLVVLDDAVSTEQVRDLLPGSSTCLVLVTSRNWLGGLVARDGAHRLALDVLPTSDATALLAEAVGRTRAAAEPEAVERLASLCGHLPLALRIAAERAAGDVHTALSTVVDELRDERSRLDVLDAEDTGSTAVRAAFSWSYQAMKPGCARMFRLLGLHPASAVSTEAAAALAGVNVAKAREVLDTLARGHLVEIIARDRYRIHDLLRVYAGELVMASEPDAERAAATRRMCGFYLSSAERASARLAPLRPRLDVGPVEGGLSFETYDAALRWYETELATLVAVVRKAADSDEPRFAWQLPTAMFDLFYLRRYWSAWLETYEIGVAAARAAGETDSEAWLLVGLGYAYVDVDRIDEAMENFTRCASGDARIRASCLQGLTFVHLARGEPDAAVSACEESLALHRELDDRWGVAWLLNNLGAVHKVAGRFPEAVRYLDEALEVSRAWAHRPAERYALANLGDTWTQVGRHDEALARLREAVSLSRASGAAFEEARALTYLGRAQLAAGMADDARTSWLAAQAIGRRLGDLRAVQTLDAQLALGLRTL